MPPPQAQQRSLTDRCSLALFSADCPKPCRSSAIARSALRLAGHHDRKSLPSLPIQMPFVLFTSFSISDMKRRISAA